MAQCELHKTLLKSYRRSNTTLRKTGYGTFQGSEETWRTLDGRELGTFRWVRSQLQSEPVIRLESQGGDTHESPFILETDSETDHALVRSISRIALSTKSTYGRPFAPKAGRRRRKVSCVAMGNNGEGFGCWRIGGSHENF